ncbi:hypothetical protein ACFL6C_11880 [Myxococcota bacterium]
MGTFAPKIFGAGTREQMEKAGEIAASVFGNDVSSRKIKDA